jgi:isopenicillin-N epimerase
VAHLNHGSFGACPRAVLQAQQALRAELEREPTDFLWRRLPSRLAAARAALGAFVGARADDLAFVTNATAGVNTVLRSLTWQAGDEILMTDHTYGACRKAVEFSAVRQGARVVVARVPFPLDDAQAIEDALLGAVTPRTRLALLDHVTSPTGLVLPLERLVPALTERGVDALVDGAHALGMLPLDLERLGAAYYTANAHKWLCAPKGCAFLHVRADRQARVHPLVISHGYDAAATCSRFREEFDWVGTHDPTPWLVLPDCLRYLEQQVPGGWLALMAHNRALVRAARTLLCDALEVAAPCAPELLGALASVPLPAPTPGAPAARLDHEGLMDWLRARGVASWSFPWPCPSGKLLRLSAQLYNDLDQYAYLARLAREAVRGA